MFKKYDLAVILTLLVLVICSLVVACIIRNYGIPETALAEPIPSIEVIEYMPEPPAPEPQLEYIGEFTITGYCPCAKCCGIANRATKSGVMPTAGQTVGADLSLLPIGTNLYIEGIGYRTVEDKPSDKTIKRYNGKIVDVFCATHEEALKVGKQTVNIYKIIR